MPDRLISFTGNFQNWFEKDRRTDIQTCTRASNVAYGHNNKQIRHWQSRINSLGHVPGTFTDIPETNESIQSSWQQQSQANTQYVSQTNICSRPTSTVHILLLTKKIQNFPGSPWHFFIYVAHECSPHWHHKFQSSGLQIICKWSEQKNNDFQLSIQKNEWFWRIFFQDFLGPK